MTWTAFVFIGHALFAVAPGIPTLSLCEIAAESAVQDAQRSLEHEPDNLPIVSWCAPQIGPATLASITTEGAGQ